MNRPTDLPIDEEPARPSRADSAGSERFSLADGEEPIAQVRTELPDPDAIDEDERYEHGPLLGEGGMGVVTLRRDRKIGRQVAQKTLHPFLAGAKTHRRFVREARAQGQLEHPAIVPVYDIGQDPKDGLFFTMKRVRGHTLARILEGLASKEPDYVSRFPRRRLLTAFLQVCRALEYAHARRVLHRDLKPSNVMLGDFGEVYVLDWGLARILDEAPLEIRDTDLPAVSLRSDPRGVDVSRITMDDGPAAGTLGYMAPEQLTGETLDPRTDVYALGVMLYEILTFRRFRADASLMTVATEMTAGRVARPSDVDVDADPELDAICARATAHAPDERFPETGALADAIERVLDGERDAAARGWAAQRHLARAKEALARTEPEGREGRRTGAMHDLLRAVTLDASGSEARSLLVELVSDESGEVPAGARSDIAKAREAHRLEGAAATMLGMLAWLSPVPFVLAVVPVRSWLVIGLAIALCAGVFVLSLVGSRAKKLGPSMTLAVAVMISIVIVLLGGILGPFVVVPTAAATCAMFFAMYVSRRERIVATAMFTAAALIPFAIDALGIVPPGFAIEGDHVVLFARVLDLPPIATPVALAWSSGSFTVLAAWMTGRMHDRLEHAEQRLLVSAWHLEQLFSTGADGAASASSNGGRRAA
jgi:serine/threonine protein kinase